MITIEGIINWMTFYQYIQLLALFLAIFLYLKSRKTFPAIILFLFISNLFEIFINYYFSMIYRNSIHVYNIFNVLNITYFYYIYYLYFKNKKEHNLVIGSYIVWLLFTIYLFLSHDFIHTSLNHYVLGLIFVVFFIVLYFKDVLNSNINVDIKKEPIFYFSLGLLTFFGCTFPMLVLPNELLIASGEGFVLFNRFLMRVGNVVLNFGYLLTVIWSYKKK